MLLALQTCESSRIAGNKAVISLYYLLSLILWNLNVKHWDRATQIVGVCSSFFIVFKPSVIVDTTRRDFMLVSCTHACD